MQEESVTLITILPNNFQFNKEIHISDINLLENDISQYLQIKTIKFSDMMETIVNDIKLTPELLGETPVIHDSATNVYQICFVGTDKHPASNQDNVNNIAAYLTGERVYGAVVFLNSKIGNNGLCSPEHSTVIDLMNILISKFIHKAVFVPSDTTQEIIEYSYYGHPLEYFKCDESEYNKYKSSEFELIGFGLCIFVNNDQNEQINKRATCLIGNKKIYGDAIVLLKSPEQYYDIGKELFNKLYKISHGPFKNRILKESEQKHGEKLNNLPIVMNKYCILESRYNNYKNECNYCKNELNKELTCTGCYRVKYHDEKCQKDDWDEHGKECLYSKDSK